MLLQCYNGRNNSYCNKLIIEHYRIVVEDEPFPEGKTHYSFDINSHILQAPKMSTTTLNVLNRQCL